MSFTCVRCGREFQEGQKIQYTGVSVFHDLTHQYKDDIIFAIDRPYACLTVRHLICDSDE